MAKKKKAAPAGNAASAKKAAPAKKAAKGGDGPDKKDPQFGILVQFIKDLSFESPNAPASLQGPGENPHLQINVQVRAIKHADEIYEVELIFESKAHSDAGVIYNIELIYAAMFQVSNIPEEHITQLLHVDAPMILFPFMRRVVADMTRDGGFQPLMLDPIDFGVMFQQNTGKAKIVDAQAEN